MVPGDFNTTVDENGDTLIYPQGDTTVPPSGRMPRGGYFFDCIVRQEPIDEEKLNPEDNMEEFSLISQEDIDYLVRATDEACATGRGVIAGFGGTAFGDIALVPAPCTQASQRHSRYYRVVRLHQQPSGLHSQDL